MSKSSGNPLNSPFDETPANSTRSKSTETFISPNLQTGQQRKISSSKLPQLKNSPKLSPKFTNSPTTPTITTSTASDRYNQPIKKITTAACITTTATTNTNSDAVADAVSADANSLSLSHLRSNFLHQTMAEIHEKFAPNHFKGHSSEDCDSFLNRFEHYATFTQLNEEGKRALFPVLLKDIAFDWYNNLPSEITYNGLKAAFRERFGPNEALKWQKVSSIWDRKMTATETSDEFVAVMKKLAKEAAMPDDMLSSALIKNLRPELRRFVVQQGKKTVDDILQAAKLAEAVETSPDLGSTEKNIAVLLQEVRQLSSKIQAQSISHIGNNNNSRSTSPAPRRVSFTDERQNAAHLRRTDYMTPQSFSGRRSASPHVETTQRCGRCGSSHRGRCWAINARCRSCSKIGHYAKMCRNGRRFGPSFNQQPNSRSPQ